MSDKSLLTLRIECPQCGGTGLYSGMGEDEATAVVCHDCKGSGESTYKYREFTGRNPRRGIRWIYETNPGIKVGGARPERFGGMLAGDWAKGKPFPLKSENRECTCPAWWYQSANYDLKPKWDECIGCGAFSGCKHFPNKAQCWTRFDAERKNP